MPASVAVWETGFIKKTNNNPQNAMSNRAAPDRIHNDTALRGFISAKAAIALAIITAGAGVLAYEWHHAHPAKPHHGSVSAHHHHKHGGETKNP
jgi:hypothetical protein